MTNNAFKRIFMIASFRLRNTRRTSIAPERGRVSNQSDSGLTRNTRCRCYRCSVPGLAGFTRLALCGARSLITHCRLPGFDLQPELNGRLAVRDYSQQAVDCQMQQHVNDDGDYQRYHQSVAAIGGGAGDDAAKRTIKRIRNG